MSAYDPNRDINALAEALAQFRTAAQAADPLALPTAGVEATSMNGHVVSMHLLSANAVRRLTGAVEAVTAFAITRPDQFVDDQAKAERLVTADIEDLFDDIDPQSYLDDVYAGPDAEASIAAFEDITGEFDGGL